MTTGDDEVRRTGPIDVWIGARLRSFREASDLTQRQVGEALGLTEAGVRKFERATQSISAARLWRLCELFGVGPSDFFDGLRESLSRQSLADREARPVSRGGFDETMSGPDTLTPSAVTLEIAQLVNDLNPVQQAVLRDMVRGIGSRRRK